MTSSSNMMLLQFQYVESIGPEIYEPTSTIEQSKRGGICVHRPTSTNLQHDRFLTFGRNIMLQTPRDVHYNISRADCLWKQAQQDDKYRAMEQPVVKKPGRKRKIDREDSAISETIKKHYLPPRNLTSSALSYMKEKFFRR